MFLTSVNQAPQKHQDRVGKMGWESRKKELQELDPILNLVYQNEVEPLLHTSWTVLSRDQLIESLLRSGVDAQYIELHYSEYLERMEKRREAIEMGCRL